MLGNIGLGGIKGNIATMGFLGEIPAGGTPTGGLRSGR